MIMKNKLCYKDREPEETLEVINEVLNELGLRIKEQWFDSGIKDIFSLRIIIEDLDVGTNGKGSSEVLAKASAYSELIERLANLILINPTFYRDFENLKYHKELPVSHFFNTKYDLWTNTKAAISQLNELYNDNSSTVNCIPIKNISNDEVIYLPSFFIPFFGSNGMGAGNSYYEMAVQAISEIFERFAMKKIITGNFDAPLIDFSFISKNFPKLNQYRKEIERKDNTVLIRDCSLGMGLPVYCVVIKNNTNSKYTVSFGAHPNFEYAIERCFTEALQCANISELKNFSTCDKNVDYYNLMSIFANGVGVYPNKLFDNKTVSTNNKLFLSSYNSNEEMYEYYLFLIKENKFNFYYYDNSYLGLSSGQFFAPNVSDIFIPTTNELINFLVTKKSIEPVFEKFDTSSYEQQKLFLNIYDLCMRYNLDLKNKVFTSELNLPSAYTLLIYLGIKNIQIANFERGIKYLNYAKINIGHNEILTREIDAVIKKAENQEIAKSKLMSLKIEKSFSHKEERKKLFDKLLIIKNQYQEDKDLNEI